MKRRFTLLAIATFLSGTLMAQWDGSTKTAPSGNGSEATPYLIANEANLAWLAQQVNNGNKYVGKIFKQTAELDLANMPWIPIGNNSKQFSGTYDGDGKAIKNLYYNDPTKSYVGLFGGINNATLKNITVVSGFVYGKQYAAGICGYAKGNSEITCCANIATIYGKQERNGGVVAYIEGTTSVEDCINYGFISSFNYSGGVVGFCNVNTASVLKCVNVGQVFSMRYTSGNCFGYNKDFNCKTRKCYYDNQINASEGWTGHNQIESDLDAAGKVEGKSTSEMISGIPLDSLSESVWEFTSGMYPRLKKNKDLSAIILAATPVSLQAGDKADNVTADFTVSTTNSVSWTSGDESNLTISGSSAKIQKSTGIAITATKDGYTKKIYLKTNHPQKTPIGSKAANTTLKIETRSDFEELRTAVNNYGSYKGCVAYDGFKGIDFMVTIDIELSSWTEPIGVHNSFKGNLDGNGRTISGIQVNQSTYSSVGGLFGCVSYGEIKNLIVSGSVSGNDLIGGISGSTFNEQMTNCKSYCTINCSGKAQTGGIAGDDRGFSTFTNCENYGTITCGQRSGGVLGRSQMGTTFIGCKNYGNVTSNADNIGGICGQVASTSGGATITGCENYGTITTATEKTNIGGIVGSVPTNATEDVTISNCINIGNVGATSAQHIGGIMGHGYVATIESCLNVGDVNGGNNVGGISGHNETNVIISNSFNAGKISTVGGGIAGNLAETSTCINCINIGYAPYQIAGPNLNSKLSNCFYDNQMNLTTGGTGKKTSQMIGTALQTILGTTNWTFTNGMYPMPTSLKESDYMIVAASALVLNDGDNIDNVNDFFTYSIVNGVAWTCSHPNYVSFLNGTGYLTYYTGDEAPNPFVITISKNNISKSILPTINAKAGKPSPGASWTLPNDEITYGTPITQEMLDAANITAPCDGHWEYSVRTDSILNATTPGHPHILTATFFPDEEYEELYSIETVTAQLTVNKKEPTIEWDPEDIYYGDSDSDSKIKTAVAKDGDVVLIGVYTYNIPPLTAGEKTVTVTFSNTNYEISTISEEKNTQKTINVSTATPSIGWTEPAAIEYGTPLSASQLGAVSGVNGEFVYTKIFGNVESAVAINDVLEVGSYTLKVAFTPTSSNYQPTTKTVPLVVTKATPVITWSNPSDITYGTALTNTQLNAGANVPGTYAYTYNGNNAEGAIPVAGDNQAISVTFTPTDQIHYTPASAEVHINVGKATPEITWTSPNISYGTALTKNMLDAQLETNSNGETSYFIDNECNNTAIGHTFGAIGNNIVYVQIAETSNYAQKIQAVSVNITQAELVLSWTPQDITYGATSDEITSNLKNAQISFNDQNIEGSTVYDIPNPLNAGEQTIKLSFVPSSSNYKPIIDSSRTINVAKATPVVTWDNPTNIDYGTSLSETQLCASVNVDASIGNITYSENDSPIAIGDVLSAGNHTITATFAPNAQNSGNYNPASTTAVISVGKTTPTITWSGPIAITFGTTLSETQLSASVNVDASIGSITYSENGSPIVIGDVLSAGNHTITATFAPNALNNGNYNSTSTTVVINVAKATPTITWSNPDDIEYGTMLSGTQLNATTDVAGSFSYSPAAGTKLNAGNNQSLTATFTPTDNNYNPTSASVTINVAKATPTITWSNPADIEYGTLLSGTQLNATTDVAGSFSYSPAAGTKLNSGNNQSLTATFTPTDANYESTSTTVVINVAKATPTITWSNPADIEYGTLLSGTQLNATTDVAGSFSYSPAAGTKLNAGNNQSLTATFTSTDNNYNSATASVTINVAKATPTITWSNPADIEYGTLLSGTQLNATADAAGSFSYSPAAGTKLNAGNNQTLTATFTPTDNNYNSTSTSVTINVAKATPTITWSNPADIEYGTLLSGTQLNATADAAGSFSYSPAAGTKLNAGNNQSLTATFTPTDNNYNPTSASVTINVAKATPTITWSNPADIEYGTLLSGTQLNASTDVAGSFSYSPAAGTKLNAGNNQSLTATFTPTDANYESATATVKINVAKATPTITWSNPADIVYGTLLSGTQLNATADAAGSFSYSPAAGTKLNAGNNQSLTATFTPTDNNYNSATASVTINVAKAEPVITWSNPADIEYGTLLSGTQLNATADAAGSFSYSPAAGTKLNAGNNQSLTATFTPTDANYKSATATVKINVAKAEPVITWNNPDDIVYGTALSGAQLNAESDAAGSFSYNPTAGTKLNAGNNQTLTATFNPTDKNYKSSVVSVKINVSQAEPTITWDNPDDIVYGTVLSAVQLNAEVDAAGKLTYSPAAKTKLNAGDNQTLTVTFAPTDTKNYKPASASVTINVAQAEPVITWEKPADIVYGTALTGKQLNAEVNAAGKFTYSPSVGTKLNAGDDQTLTATFVPNDTKNYTTVSAEVKINVAKADAIITWNAPADIVYGTALTNSMLNATANVLGTFEYTPAADAILNAGVQELSAVFTPADTANYNTVSVSVQIGVAKADPVLAWSKPSDIVYGTPLADSMLNATANVLGDFEYTPAADAMLNAGAQTLSAVFTPADTANYNSASTAVEIFVAKANPEIVWNNPSDIVYGTPIADSMLNASANVLGDFEYTPAADAILNAGTQELSAVFTPADTANYNSASATVEIVVAKANPEIVWNNPNDIVYGTALTDSILNASANVLGNFEYTPAADAILNAGVQVLSAVFTPADTANYNSASATVEIVVAKANPEIVWNNPNDIVYGTALTDSMLNATANVLGDFEYTPAADSILTSGIHELSVVFTPADTANYYPASATAQIVVEKAEPIITWSEPNRIVYGTVLADSMLSATIDVDGVLSYLKPTDSVLQAGDYPIIAMFIAADSNYMAASDTTTLTVTKATLTVTAINDTIVIGSELPEFQIAYSGFVFGDDTSSLTTLATATCNVPADSIGTFEIMVSGGEADNYTFEYVSGYLTVIDVPVVPVITWTPAVNSITYGTLIDSTILNAKADVDGTFTYSAIKHGIYESDTTLFVCIVLPSDSTDLITNDTNIYSVHSINIGDTLSADFYELVATFHPANASVASISDTVQFVVNKAELDVYVADVTINQYDKIPEFDITYQGFVLGENKTDLYSAPIIDMYLSTDEAGTFDILFTPGISLNYNFNYHKGKLTIVAKEDTTAIAETEVTLMAYPNPTNGMFVVETNSNVEYIYVYNAVGKLVATEMNIGTTRFNLTNEPEGTYFVKVGEKTIKLMKF